MSSMMHAFFSGSHEGCTVKGSITTCFNPYYVMAIDSVVMVDYTGGEEFPVKEWESKMHFSERDAFNAAKAYVEDRFDNLVYTDTFLEGLEVA